MGTDLLAGHPPRFRVGDHVTIVGLGAHRGMRGEVVQVMEGALDFVHRYFVRLENGTLTRCFGFELEAGWAEWSKPA